MPTSGGDVGVSIDRSHLPFHNEALDHCFHIRGNFLIPKKFDENKFDFRHCSRSNYGNLELKLEKSTQTGRSTEIFEHLVILIPLRRENLSICLRKSEHVFKEI